MASRSLAALGDMAAKSVSGVTSVVSLMKEKTVVAFRCNTRGCERVIYPMLVIAIIAAAFILLATAMGTEVWVQVNVAQEDATSVKERGWLQFGLFRGSHSVRGAATVIQLEDSYNIFDQFTAESFPNVTSIPLGRIYAAITFDCIAFVIGLVAIAVTLINTYQTVTTWWKGPPMMYIFSLLTSLAGLISVALFLDFYLWDLEGNSVLVYGTEIVNLNYVYSSSKYVGWSFGLQLTGSLLPLFATLLSWRLAVLVPQKDPKEDNMGASPSMFGMSPMAGSSFQDPIEQDKGSVLY